MKTDFKNQIINGDSLEELKKIPSETFDLVFADPPYNLQLKGELTRPDRSKVSAVNDKWDQFENFKKYDDFTYAWLAECKRILKKDGAIWVIGSYHNIFRVGTAIQNLGFWILNDVIWNKNNPMPNFRGTRFTNAHETLIWASKSEKSKYTFNYQSLKCLNDDLQMRSNWNLPICNGSERLKKNGKKVHSTQKPESLLHRVLLASSNKDDMILDPFLGSGTTATVAKKLGRSYFGIEKEKSYFKAADQRLKNTKPIEDELLDTLKNNRSKPRIPFGSLVELGIIKPGTNIFDNKKKISARIMADGSIKHEQTEGSIHKVAATILGAESFGFGTGPMVALGCKYLRICHLNNCATGVATQNDRLRNDHYRGTVAMATNFFKFMAMETREWMASVGVRSLEELIGRVDLLETLPGTTTKQQNLDLAPLIEDRPEISHKPQFCQEAQNDPFDKGLLAEQMVKDMLPAIESKSGGSFEYNIGNCDRSIGARLSGEIASRYGNSGMADTPVAIKLKGVAGQSLGVWNAGGLDIYLEGDANDYVGKGMSGGKIVLSPPSASGFQGNATPIMGNTCLYGATGGSLYAAGSVGERFGVRNSGALAVVEGAGDHCCEYMTGGIVTVLGSTGYNFGAGMTGGFAYVLDTDRKFVDRYNMELIDIQRVSTEALESHRGFLKSMIEDHARETGSVWSQHILDNFSDFASKFWLVKPKASSLQSLLAQANAVSK